MPAAARYARKNSCHNIEHIAYTCIRGRCRTLEWGHRSHIEAPRGEAERLGYSPSPEKF